MSTPAGLIGQILGGELRFRRQAIGRETLAYLGQQTAHLGIVDAQHRDPVERHFVDEGEKVFVQAVPWCRWKSICSLSILVTTAMVGASSRKLPSLSSASATMISPCAQLGVAAEHMQPAADHHGRVQTGGAQHRRNHRRGRGLAVAAGHGDADISCASARRAFRRAGSPGYGAGALPRPPDWQYFTAVEITTTDGLPAIFSS